MKVLIIFLLTGFFLNVASANEAEFAFNGENVKELAERGIQGVSLRFERTWQEGRPIEVVLRVYTDENKRGVILGKTRARVARSERASQNFDSPECLSMPGSRACDHNPPNRMRILAQTFYLEEELNLAGRSFNRIDFFGSTTTQSFAGELKLGSSNQDSFIVHSSARTSF